MMPAFSTSNSRLLVILSVPLVLAFSTRVLGRTPSEARPPKGHPNTAQYLFANCATTHKINKLALTISNLGTIGEYYVHSSRWAFDCFTGERAPGMEYPVGSRTQYLYGGAFWIGGVVGTDTLVSTGNDGVGLGKPKYDPNMEHRQAGMELFPDAEPFGLITRRSIMDPLSPSYKDAVSEEDLIAVYTDTFTRGVPDLTYDYQDGRSHIPLNIEVTQKSYGWSYTYAEDFILFDYTIKNIGEKVIRDSYFGIFLDPDIYGAGNEARGYQDDLVGFLREYETPYGDCKFKDTFNIMWAADNEGDWSQRVWVTSVIGVQFLSSTDNVHEYPSFNWWVTNYNPAYDFGPRRRGTPEHPFRDFRTGSIGTPRGDKNKYYQMSNGEIDYDQYYMLDISPLDPVWTYPTPYAAKYITRGYDASELLSIGPVTLPPHLEFKIVFAVLAGENFHTTPMNYRRNLQLGVYHPERFEQGLGFGDLAHNAKWASWVYDNPGVDTDGDGYFGKFRLCVGDRTIIRIDTVGSRIDTLWGPRQVDTMWYEGDGIPDFLGASPPPAPEVRVIPKPGKFIVQWYGMRSETSIDVFSRRHDFDGYRVYLSRDSRPESFMLMASYDLENYLKYDYDPVHNVFEIHDDPFSREQLICLYGDSCNDPYFDPRNYTKSSPLFWGDSVFYFVPQDFNRSDLGVNTPIRRIYPNAPYPFTNDPEQVPDSLKDLYLTEDGHFKYYEYEYTIENLLPTVPYYVNVTAFDYGSPLSGLDALETPVTRNAKEVYPLNGPADVEAENLPVYVYPNPYRIDGDYLQKGYEGRDAEYYIPDRLHRIHFVNLPAKCTISILTLDGDLVRRFEHDKDPSDPTSSHDTWDLITRNTQAVVSGIYYWTVQDDNGKTQIGKLVIIK